MVENTLAQVGLNEEGTLIIVSIVIGVLALIVGIIAVVLLLKGRKGGNATGDVDVKGEINALREDIKMSNNMTSSVLNVMDRNNRDLQERVDKNSLTTEGRLDNLREQTYQSINALKDSVSASINELKESTARNINEMKAVNTTQLQQVRDDNNRIVDKMIKDNAEQLKNMREVVDEKLSSTLENRFNASFKIVNDRLEEINRTFNELQGLQSGISDLNKIFKNVKTRGTWGEVSLETLLEQILTYEQYDKQVRIKRGSQDLVDFVIKMPGKGSGEVLLPIDAKFPMDDYARLCEASDRGDSEGVDSARKALKTRIMEEARSIRDKYISVPKTTDFAILYLPTESLFAEVLRIEGLAEDVQTKTRVMVCGPTTIAALLNSLQMGFKSVAAEKHSAEIVKLFKNFVVDFEKFAELLRKTGTQLDAVQKTIGNAESRTEIIRKKLDKMSKYNDDELVSTSEDVELLTSEVAGEIVIDDYSVEELY